MKRVADNKRRYAPSKGHSACLLWEVSKGGSTPFDTRLCIAKCNYTLCRRCRFKYRCRRGGQRHLKRQECRALFGAGKPETKGWFQQQTGTYTKAPSLVHCPPAYGTNCTKPLDTVTICTSAPIYFWGPFFSQD